MSPDSFDCLRGRRSNAPPGRSSTIWPPASAITASSVGASGGTASRRSWGSGSPRTP